VRRFRPDVVHTHSAKGGLLGRAAAWSLGVPAVIHTVHGAPWHPWQGRPSQQFFQVCEHWAARRCHALVSVADAMTDLMVSAGVAPREKCTTIYSGMEVEPFLDSAVHRTRVRRELGYSDEHIVVGKIARLFKLKGHGDVIRAARSIIDANRNVRFLFVGDGVARDALKRQIVEAGLNDYFQFTGLVPPERIPELIAATDMVVHASLREGLARVLPQALISGKPVVSYDIDGAREVVIPDQTGFLIPPLDVDGLAFAMKSLAADPALRERFGLEGRRRFSDVFRHEHQAEQLHRLYLEVLGRKKGMMIDE
jgi:glycosyltransferase involved in cell wall biosynthesis